ncbi:NAD(P)/FAD-dependent oxidoreductase [Streptomyces profundus]|nr:NAD(P)/FAD-dependent oxidoreductase [Streptomyces sp. MA3_2.13]
MAREWDAIVVGAGLAGLTSAAYLAAAGRRVLVLEQHDIAGGNSHVFRRRRRYEFDVGVHYVGDCGADGTVPAILAGLGARDRVEFREMDPDCFDRVVLPGLTLDVPASWPEYRARLAKAMPEETTGLDTFTGIVQALGAEQRAALLAGGEPTLTEMLAMTPTVREWGRRPLAALFDHCGLSARARTVLAAQSPNYGLSPQDATVGMHATVIDHYIRGAYFPVGGGQVLAATLVEALEANGGALVTRCLVDRLLVRDRTVGGVALADGTEFHAPLVISNADYRRTMLELVGEEHLARPVVRKTREARMTLPFATVYVALDREIARLGGPYSAEAGEANIWWYDTEDIDDYYRELATGRLPDEVRFLFASFSSLKDPGSRHMCPPGHSNFQLMTVCPPEYEPWGVSGGPADGVRYRRQEAYRAAKEEFTERVLVAAERLLGPFRDHVVHLETATPLTQERYTRSTGGTPYGIASWGGHGTRPDLGTGIAGLYAVGQSSRYGSGITGVMVGGMACAGAVLGRRLMSEVHAGAVIGDPDRLPERAADWDPLVVSRGVARRSARGLARME